MDTTDYNKHTNQPMGTCSGKLRFLWRNWLKPMAIVLVVCGSFRSAVADWNIVPTASMNPTIVEGDRIFVNKLAYGLRIPFTMTKLSHWSAPQRGDVVVFFSPENGQRLVKRVVGIPGDRVAMRNGHVYVNDQPASYAPIDQDILKDLQSEKRRQHQFATEIIDGQSHPIMIADQPTPSRNFPVVKVPDNQYFMMGDNRDHSRDSRWFGCVSEKFIVGRVNSVVLSLDADNYHLPRWDRFFQPLP